MYKLQSSTSRSLAPSDGVIIIIIVVAVLVLCVWFSGLICGVVVS